MKSIKWLIFGLFFVFLNTISYGNISSKEFLTCGQGLILAQKGKFPQAFLYVKNRSCPITYEIVTWLYLKSDLSLANFEQIVNFLQSHKEWPLENVLKNRAELSLSSKDPIIKTLKWFQSHSPQTVKGLILYTDILRTQHNQQKAFDIIRSFWIEKDFSSKDEKKLLKKFQGIIGPKDIKQRAITLLNKKKIDEVNRLMPNASHNTQIYIQTRLALQKKDAKADQMIEENNVNVLEDPDLAKDYLTWLRNREDPRLDDHFHQVQDKFPHYPEKFWSERHIRARDVLEARQYDEAYQLSSQHHLKDGVDYVEAEWFSGWMSLRFLKNSQQALKHFLPLLRKVKTSISKAKILYWVGRCYEDIKDQSKAQSFYQQAATHIHTFYGQQAFNKLDKVHKKALPGSIVLTKTQLQQGENKKLIHVMKILAKSGLKEEALLFARILIKNSHSAAECQHVLLLVHELMPEYAVTISHQIARQHPVYYKEAYPVLHIDHAKSLPRDIDQALAHAIIRQESAFNPTIVSGAGALGLMQLMPTTAELMASSQKIKYKGKQSLFNPVLNIKLGGHYLKEQLKQHNQSYILTLAAYNAGPEPVKRWLDRFSDPRDPNVDPIDWIESVPYGETRSYIQRVLENHYVYEMIFKKTRNIKKIN